MPAKQRGDDVATRGPPWCWSWMTSAPIAAAVVRRLERDGAICVASYSGTEGIERLASEPYDLVVTDIEMPGNSGWISWRARASSPRRPR